MESSYLMVISHNFGVYDNWLKAVSIIWKNKDYYVIYFGKNIINLKILRTKDNKKNLYQICFLFC